MTAALTALVGQIVEHGIGRLRLFANAVHHLVVGRYTLGDAHLILQPATGREALCQPAVEDGLPLLYQALLTGLLAILQGIEGIEQHAAAEAQLHMVDGLTVVAADGQSRVVFQRVTVYVGLPEVVGQLGLHLRGGIERCERLGAQLVEALLPRGADKLAVVGSLRLAHHPLQGDGLASVHPGKGGDGGGERQLARVAARRLHIGIAEGERGTALLVVEAQIAHGGASAQNDLTLLVGGESLGRTGVEVAHHGERAARPAVVDTRQRCRQAVFSEVPALRGVERRCLGRRPQVFVIPEAWQIEVAVVGGIVRGDLRS